MRATQLNLGPSGPGVAARIANQRVIMVVAIAAMAAAPLAVRAQETGGAPTSVVGPTGNASAYAPNRVPTALNDPGAMSRLRAYQSRPGSGTVNPLSPLGGSGAPLLLPGQLPASEYYLDNVTSTGLFGLGMGQATRLNPEGMVTNPFLPQLDAPRYYGGFGQRNGMRGTTTLDGMLRRRPSMIAAYSLDAPVKRALGATSSFPPASFGRQGGEDALRLEGDAPRPTTVEELNAMAPLSERAGAQIEVMGTRAKAEAWEWFHAGEYRKAIRKFQSAVTLDANDPDPRIGEMFCYLATGGYRTAAAAMEEIVRRTANPFMFDLDLRDGRFEEDIRRFGTLQEVRRMRTVLSEIRDVSFADATRADRIALISLSLWYLGQRESARGTLMRGLDPAEPSAYSDWPQLMVDANARVPVSNVARSPGE